MSCSSCRALFLASIVLVSLALVRAASVTTEDVAQNPDKVWDLLKQNEVVIMSKSYCPFCRRTKKLFAAMDVSPVVMELDQLEKGRALQDALYQKTGQRTVPFIFIGGKLLGGSDDLVRAMHENTLANEFKDLGIQVPQDTASILNAAKGEL